MQTATQIKETLAPFKGELFAHRSFEDALEATMMSIRYPSDSLLLPLVGPTGAGKTSLAKSLLQMLAKEKEEELKANPTYLLALTVDITPLPTPNAIWLNILNKLMEQLDGFPPRRCDPTQVDEKPSFSPVTKTAQYAALYGAAVSLIKERRPQVIILDESQHLIKTRSDTELRVQFNTLKRLADECQTPLVLIGPYPLCSVLSQDGQLGRRSDYVHLPAYKWTDKNDRESFLDVLAWWNESINKVLEADITAEPEFMFELCLGCVGALKNNLYRAMASSLHLGKKKLELDVIARTGLSFPVKEKMLEEIEEGLKFFTPDPVKHSSFRASLGLSVEPEPGSPPTSEKPSSKKNRVGQRKTFRDPVGTQNPALC